MASIFRTFWRISIGLVFLTSLGAQSLSLLTDDPEWLRVVLDSVATGTAQFQMKTGTDMPFSQRINSRLSPFITIRTYSRAGPDKSIETGNVSLELNNISLTTGPVLISHACGFVTGRATSRHNLYPGNINFKSNYNIRLSPVLFTPFTGFGVLTYKRFSFSSFTTGNKPGFFIGWRCSHLSLSTHYSPDHWLESLFQFRLQNLLIRINGSFTLDLWQSGHLYTDIVLKNKNSGMKIMCYTTSKNFRPLNGKNPWFGGETASCSGGGGGVMIKFTKSITINASVVQQISQNNKKVIVETSLIGKLFPSFNVETLIRYNNEQILITEKTFPFTYSYQFDELYTIRQAFQYTFRDVLILQTNWSASYDRDFPSTAGLVSLQYRSDYLLLKMQFSQAYGGTADLWFVRPFAGTQISIRKVPKGSVSCVDITGEVKIRNIIFAAGISFVNGSPNAVIQIKFALDSMNR